MDIVVVLEADTRTDLRLPGPDRAPTDPENPLRRAHTAPAEASGVCGPLTLCGLDTSEMTLAPHGYAGVGRPRPRLDWRTCGTCRTAGGSPAPGAPGPLTPDRLGARTVTAAAPPP
ncbi:hypothetical protein [Streptomyces sp. NRRL S-350]|uniref:hypothetical protein n=1 Tax=Streptomyces sp. NRRL S-350 TaxID=1463902 RepID=UPI0004BFC73B|nr:hypothetical protein [Streptomyces sp. NRRL S-350]